MAIWKYGLGLAAALLSSPASAALISQSFNMKASNFKAYERYADYPYRSFDIDVTVSFDNSSDIEATKDGFFTSAYSGDSQFDLKYAYVADDDVLIISTKPFVASDLGPGCNAIGGHLCFFVSNASTTLADANIAPYAFYSAPVANEPDKPFANYVSPRVITKLTSAVPEPSTWLMMIAGFVATGFALRRRQSRSSLSGRRLAS